MARKQKTDAPAAQDRPHEHLSDDQLADAVRDSARQIWQAGLGAFAKARQEGGDAFSALVQDGAQLQERAQQAGAAGGIADRRAGGPRGSLEQVFEERVARALEQLGIPARTEIEELKHRVAELERMLAQHAGVPRRPPAPRAATKPAAKKTVGKKPAGPPV